MPVPDVTSIELRISFTEVGLNQAVCLDCVEMDSEAVEVL